MTPRLHRRTAEGRDEITEDPRVVRSRAIIVAAATAQFLEHGYRATNVDDIATRAGVSKRTIYNIFGGKEQLFRAILADALQTAERFSADMADHLGAAADMEAGLKDTAIRLAHVVLSGPIIPLRRLLIGEVARFPEVAREYYRRAPGRVIASIARELQRFAERGLLNIDDAELAAEQFAFLVLGASLDRALFGALEDAQISVESRALAGVDAFLRVYAADR